LAHSIRGLGLTCAARATAGTSCRWQVIHQAWATAHHADAATSLRPSTFGFLPPLACSRNGDRVGVRPAICASASTATPALLAVMRANWSKARSRFANLLFKDYLAATTDYRGQDLVPNVGTLLHASRSQCSRAHT